MYLSFDTETADLPRSYTAPETDTRNWPRLIQLAWVSCDSAGKAGVPQVHLIQPDGFSIAGGAFDRHGISTQFATDNGVALRPVLDSFIDAVDTSDTVIAHNVEFDANIVGAECVRAGRSNPIRRKRLRCTMKESTNHCRLPGHRGFKWPTLAELHSVLFQTGFENAHDAASDCLACMRCFFRLRELKAIS
jgi:DNA polymerase III epsilon subunit-like protein